MESGFRREKGISRKGYSSEKHDMGTNTSPKPILHLKWPGHNTRNSEPLLLNNGCSRHLTEIFTHKLKAWNKGIKQCLETYLEGIKRCLVWQGVKGHKTLPIMLETSLYLLRRNFGTRGITLVTKSLDSRSTWVVEGDRKEYQIPSH